MTNKIKMEIVHKLLENKTSSRIIVSSFHVFKFSKQKRKTQTFIFILAIIPSIFIGMSVNTQEIAVNSFQTILDVILALFGIVFTGYSFFQALINKELLIRMMVPSRLDKDGEDKSKLQETNESFVECMMLNLISIILTLLLRIVIECIPNDFLLFGELWQNNVLAVFLLLLYFYFIITIIFEVKSFIFNIFQLFNVYAGTKIVNIIKEENNL